MGVYTFKCIMCMSFDALMWIISSDFAQTHISTLTDKPVFKALFTKLGWIVLKLQF